ncbi:carboxypeptidase regulatory-like domain-containing protein [Draconibacterium sp. IB214405]|uniref:carboxypeptidase regulatory-like domain-containing protein n=1 Tax=Draconibacterium sp. IB214405 TaxID=3097352 RepID=UPI002A0D74F3|nr:carboxypeptidase regulatory-like domain-containing protein [Draconibacterium sp. IB214405]MDX8341747.1 carboxypeptidase regulatory-like domain-containing protein [Draconibacterium sp. IB214405]
MNKHFIILLIAILAFSCIEEEPLIVTGTAKGIVTDIETGEPLSGAAVSMGSAGTKLSDSDGNYEFTDLPAGEYDCVVTKNNYESTIKKVVVSADMSVVNDFGLQLIGAGLKLNTTTIDFGFFETEKSIILGNRTGNGTVTYNISTSNKWITVSPSSGTINSDEVMVKVTFDKSGLTPGNYNGTILVAGGDAGNATVNVSGKVMESAKPVVNINTSDAITKTSFTINAEITSVGSSKVSEYGIVWSKEPNPTINNQKRNLGTSETTKTYTVTVSNLESLTNYHVRAYAMNNEGTSYSSELMVTTLDPTSDDPAPPVVYISSVSDITETGWTVNWGVSDVGEPKVISHGLCVSADENPTKQNLIEDMGSLSIGKSYTTKLNGASENTTFYVRAYAENETGISYSNPVEVSTLSAYPKTVSHEAYTMNILSCTRDDRKITIKFNVQNNGRYTTEFNGGSSPRPTLHSSAGDVLELSASSFGNSYWFYSQTFAPGVVIKGEWIFDDVPTDIRAFSHLRFQTWADKDESGRGETSKAHTIENIIIQN